VKAKEYLQKITFLDSKIDSNKERVRRYKESAENKTSNLSPNKVQTSTSKQKMADAVCSYSDLERIIKADEEKKQEIIDTIGMLNPNESTVLYKCYADAMTLWEISKDMDRSYSWVSKMHSRGVKNIQQILDSRKKAGD
jgi:DNA-directed RNA polymerase specialized sigma subunit